MITSWWRNAIDAALLASGGVSIVSPHKGPVMWSFGVFFVVERAVEQTVELAVKSDALALMWCHPNVTCDMIQLQSTRNTDGLCLINSRCQAGYHIFIIPMGLLTDM